MRILYVAGGDVNSTSHHRSQALRRIGHEIKRLDLVPFLSGQLRGPLLTRYHFYSGYRRLQSQLAAHVATQLEQWDEAFDLVWVDSGEWLGVRPLRVLKQLACPVLLYNVDDPTGRRDHGRFASLRTAIGEYDSCVVVRDESAREFATYGARQIIKVWRSYDEVAHVPFPDPSAIPSRFHSDVCFVGTWMRSENREDLILQLAEAGVDVAFWGNRWQKSRLWRRIRPYYRGAGIAGRDYVAALQGAKICLGLLSKANRDLHTQRSMEIPFAGGLLCAERTREHLELYRDGHEAVLWSTPEECLTVCRQLLADDCRRETIRLAGMTKVRRLSVGNEDICRSILEQCLVSHNASQAVGNHSIAAAGH